MITIHEFKRKYFLTEADAPAPTGGATPPPTGGAAAAPTGGATPPTGGLGGATPPPDLGGLGGSLGGATPPPSFGSDLGGSIGAGATGTAPVIITDISKLNPWDLLEKYYTVKRNPKDHLEEYL